ncbi:MAG TPA: creatininase family protein [Chloroflexota bacterium]|nr:creatininase family protein [Chloroflexota bacterium]
MQTYRYEELSWPQVREAVAQDPVVVLPVGTTEQHGPHLPLMTDYVTAGGIADSAVRRLAEEAGEGAPPALVMHPVAYSFNEHHLDYPGTIAIDAHTIIDYLACIGRSLAHHGFRHIVLYNGHGSNAPFIDIAARLVNNQTQAICAALSWWSLLRPEDLGWRESPYPGGFSHACEAETSLLLHLRADLVDMTKAVRTMDEVQRSEHIYWDLAGGGPVSFQEFFSRNSSTGIQGDPTLATEEKGRLLAAAATKQLASFLLEFRAREIRPRRDFHAQGGAG